MSPPPPPPPPPPFSSNPVETTGFVSSSATLLPTSQRSSVKALTNKIPTSIPLPTSLSSSSFTQSITTCKVPTLSTSLQSQLAAQSFNGPAPAVGSSATCIVLFRSDLRLDDHPALTTALEQHATVIPLFCFDPRHFGRTPHGFDKTGKYRARFLIESVEALRTAIRSKGSDLIVRIGKPEDMVSDIADRVGASKVFVHNEVTYEDQLVEKEMKKKLKKKNIELITLWSNTLYHRDDMPFPLSKMPDVYSDFRESVEQSACIKDPLPTPKEIPNLPPSIEVGNVPTLADLGITDNTHHHHITSMAKSHSVHGVATVRGGEKEALTRVSKYVTNARALEAQRLQMFTTSSSSNLKSNHNHNVAAHIGADFSCRISPWLALGCVSPRRIFYEMKNESNSSTSLLRSSTYFELVWRDFFRCITAKYSEKRAASATRVPAKTSTVHRSLAHV